MQALDEHDMSQTELAARTGHSPKMINEIVMGKAPITPKTALELERVLLIPARFWLNRESQYRETLARLQDRARLEHYIDWLDTVPYREMAKAGWISGIGDRVDQLREVLRFFRVSSPDEWQAVWCQPACAFRKSATFEADPGAVAAWLREGEILAQKIDCEPFNAAAFREALTKVRALSTESPNIFVPETVRLCAQTGVAVVFVPQLLKTRASGVTRWLSKSKALIQLSLRYKTDDHLWFTFFHESAHLLLHGKREVFIENGESNAFDSQEEEANEFAREFLVASEDLGAFLASGRPTQERIESFAREIGIAPGIIVGRLQHDGVIQYRSASNRLKRHLEWASEGS